MDYNIHQFIQKEISKDPAIKKDLQRKLLNVRALAKYFIKKNSLNASLDAVISAIRRYKIYEEKEEKLISIFKNSTIKTKNNLVCIHLRISKDVLQKINQIQNHPKLTIGENELILIVDEFEKEKTRKILEKEIINIEAEISEVSIRVSEIAIKTKGVLAKITNELALEDINIKEILVCPPVFLIYVKQKDIIKAHESILKMTKHINL